jgi:RNA polymerase sigma-70 factor (ECF subfamily)
VFFEEQELSPPPESILSAQDELAIIQRAILQLPAKCRKSFLLNRIHGLTVDVVAKQMGLTGRMVRMHVARALAHCKKCLDEAEPRN